MKRTIQRLVQDQLAMRLLRGEFGEGDTVRVDAADGELIFARMEVPEAVAAGS